MAGLIFSPESRGQFAAIVRVRWQLVANSLQSLRGRFELISRIFVGVMFAGMGIGLSFGFGLASWYFVSHGQLEWIALLLWGVFLFWQIFPILGTAFTEVLDASNLLRFPITYPAYFIVRLAYGSLDPSTFLGTVFLFGIWVGVLVASPALALWAALLLIVFALLNVFLARMIFAWIERWLARRRTREIMGVVFFLFIIGIQFIGPVMSRFEGKHAPAVGPAAQVAEQFLPVERVLPAGLVGVSLARLSSGSLAPALGGFALLCIYTLLFFWLLDLRLRAQYLGENLSEAVAQRALSASERAVRPGWAIPGLPGPVVAIIEKEFRYLFRSGPMLFTVVMPVVVLLIFRFSASAPGRRGGLLARTPDLAFPIGAAYALLILTNLVFNCFGPDAVGVQTFFAAPVRFRSILVAKNLAHTALALLETVIVFVAVCLIYGPPGLDVVLVTLSGILFALPVNFAIGNLLSIYAPKKTDLGAFGRQKASSATQFAALGAQAVVFGLASVILLFARMAHALWLAGLAFLALAAIAITVYSVLLTRTEHLALTRREVLIAELSRA
jgi:ABC-2 type transport system permease protein